jgi:Rieske Fe-S protein
MLAGIGAAGVVVALAGCGSSGGSSTGTTGSGGTGGGNDAGATSGDSSGGGSGGTGAAPINVSDIPTGGGKVFPQQNFVVTQPTAGNFKAFTATCTHQGCQVSKVLDGMIDCPCHGSQYSIVDGSVKNGPAPRPLPSKTVTVNGDSLTVS